MFLIFILYLFSVICRVWSLRLFYRLSSWLAYFSFVLFCIVCLFVCHQIVINKQKMYRVKGLPHNSQPVCLLPWFLPGFLTISLHQLWADKLWMKNLKVKQIYSEAASKSLQIVKSLCLSVRFSNKNKRDYFCYF